MNPIVDIFCYENDTHNVPPLFALFEKVHVPTIHSVKLTEVKHKFKMYSNEPICFSFDLKKEVTPEDLPDIVLTGVGTGPEAEPYKQFVLDVMNGKNVSKDPLFNEFHTVISKPLDPKNEKEYSLKKEQTSRGWMVYEIRRPREDPFTIVLRDYHDHGMEPMFIWIYHCKAWGIMYNDLPFLQAVWEAYKEPENLQGAFDDEKMNELTEKYRHLYLEPEIYRRSIKHVVRQLEEESEDSLKIKRIK